MPYQFQEQERQRYSDVPLKWDVPFNEWLGVKFGRGFNDTFGNVISKNAEESIWDNGDLMKPEVANQAFGIDGELSFDQPISIQLARLRRERKDAELRARTYSEVADHGYLSSKAAAGFAAGVLGSIAHPFDLALGFLVSPIGSSAKAAQLASRGAGTFRTSVARGLIQRESLQALKYPRLTEAVIEGTFGNLVAEIPVYLQAQKDQADYTLLDSIINVGAGGIFASGLHLGIHGIARAKARLKSAADTFQSLTPETKAESFKKALDQTLRDEDIDVSRVIALDEKVIEAQVRFDEAIAISQAKSAVALESRDIEALAIEQIGRPKLDGMNAVNEAPFIKLTVPEGATFVRVTDGNGKTSIQPLANVQGQNPLRGADIRTIEAGTMAKNEKGKTAFQPMAGEVKAVEAKVTKGSARVDRATFERKVEELRQQRIKEYVDSMREDFEIQRPEKLELARENARAELKANHAKEVPPEKQKDLVKKLKVEESEITALDKEAGEILKDIDRELTPEEKALFQKELDELSGIDNPEKAMESLMAAEKEVDQGKRYRRLSDDDFKSITDTSGFLSVPKLLSALESGKIKSGPASVALLRHLLKESDKHPLGSIEIVSHFDSSSEAGYQGKFQQMYGTNRASVKVVNRTASGKMLTENTLVRVLNHELLHNSVTSKLGSAPKELKDRARALFQKVKEESRGTEWENHNALSSVDEFFAEALSRSSFRDWLTTVKYEDNVPRIGKDSSPDLSSRSVLDNAFNGFLRLVKDLIGIKDKLYRDGQEIDAIDALTETIHLSEQLEMVHRPEKAYPTTYFLPPDQASKVVDLGIPCIMSEAHNG